MKKTISLFLLTLTISTLMLINSITPRYGIRPRPTPNNTTPTPVIYVCQQIGACATPGK